MDPPSLFRIPSSSSSSSSNAFADAWPPLDPCNLLQIHPRKTHPAHNLAFSDAMAPGSARNASAAEASTVTEQSGGGGGGRKRRDVMPASEDVSPKLASTGTGNNEMADSDGKCLKVVRSIGEKGDSKEVEASSGNGNMTAEQNAQPSEAPKQDYIHVRARRGQATDSHSLAERARREKISERMKILQDLVPGCNKVIGKALVLDEIINYIQSLQRQVEFLSMKLEAVNSRMSSSMEGFPVKDPFDASGLAFTSQATREYGQDSPPEWLHMQVGGSFENAT